MSELRAILVRIAEGVERLADDPVIQVETGPPVCPHCERMNPSVRVSEREAVGSLGLFVIQAQCQHCNNVFYALPEMWTCVQSIEQARESNAERADRNGFNG